MLRGFANARAAPMDPEHGLSVSHVSSRRSNAQRRLDAGASQVSSQTTAASSFGRVILIITLALLVLGVLPAMFVFWACIIVLIFTCLRLRVQAQHVHQVLQQEDLGRRVTARLHLGTSGSPVLRVIPGAGLLVLHTDPEAAIQHFNTQLRYLDNLDEEMGFMDTGLRGAFTGAAGGAPAFGAMPPPVSEADIAALPCYTYKLPRGTSAAAGPAPTVTNIDSDASTAQPAGLAAGEAIGAAAGTAEGPGGNGQNLATQSLTPSSLPTTSLSAASGQQAASPGRPGVSSGGATQGAGTSGSEVARARSCSGDGNSEGGVAGPAGLTCPVCLDAVAEGSTVMTLPCLHQFHAACVTPWLRQQGIYAPCPMCKTPVFH